VNLKAVALGDETLRPRRRDGALKLLGVALCVIGAVLTSAYQGTGFLGFRV